jgi:hypothetical protein
VYDRLSTDTVMGTGFYVEEIRRREQVRANEAAHRLAQQSHRTAQASVALSVVAILISVLATIVGRT